MNVEFELAARLEFHGAVEWYESRETGLGREFADAIEKTVALISQVPDRWRCVEEDIRRCLVHRFPYAVLYTIEPDGILILAVMHCSRKPGYWRRRRSAPGA